MKTNLIKLSALSTAIIAATPVMAGGFDKSGRDFNIIYGDNDVITTSYGMSSVPMAAKIQQGAGNTSSVIASGNILEDINRPQLGFRYHPVANMTCAAQYEQPFGAEVGYADDTLAYAHPLDNSQSVSAPISTLYESESLTFACGYDLALSTGKVTVFGGPKIQEVKGAFDEDLSHSPLATGESDNLTVSLDGGAEVGYIMGAAYSIPEIALRASVLYHSQIDYSAKGTIAANIPGFTSFVTSGTAQTFTPQTVEIALQSGIAENTLAFVKMRWSEYGKLTTLKVKGDESTKAQNGLSLEQIIGLNAATDALINPEVSMFSNDTFDYSIGLGRKLNEDLTLGASFSGSIKLGGKSADTPLGADSTSLRLPGDTAHTVSFGGEYTVIPKLKLNGGFAYTFIDEYRVETVSGSYRAEFGKTEATSFQMGLSYEI